MNRITKPETENEDELDFQMTLDNSNDVQFQNAVFVIGRIETDHGGLSINEIWKETENLRMRMIRTPREKRETVLLAHAVQKILEKYGHNVRTLMCILVLFALRLIKASKTPDDDNPHSGLIRAIVRQVNYYAVRDEQLMQDLRELVNTIDTDGDNNEARGKVVKFGEDILAISDDWRSRLRDIVEVYKKKADENNIIQYGAAGDAFDRVWEALLEDEQFVREMKHNSLSQDFNLLLIFNIYGLMYPWAYNTKIRGANGIAKVIGHNPKSRNKDHYYSKDYFNVNEIEKLNKGIKTQSMLNHIKEIINSCKTENHEF